MRFRLRRLPEGCVGRIGVKAYSEAASDPWVVETVSRAREAWRERYGYYPGEGSVSTTGTEEER